MISENSQGNLFDGPESTPNLFLWLRGASPASLTAKLAEERATEMTVTSGRRCLGLWKKSGPLGSLVRTLLESSHWRSTMCSLTWSVRATPAKRLLFRLRASGHRTSESGSGLWHTPNVPNGGRVNPLDMTPTGKMPNGKKRQVGLEHQVRMVEGGMWPTPHANCSTGAGTQGRQGGLNLQTAVRLLPTPRVAMARQCRLESHHMPATSGQLNPAWVEWLMGYPEGWTDLEASETPSCRRSATPSLKR